MQKTQGKKLLIISIILILLYMATTPALSYLGKFLIRNDALQHSEATVVLATGVDYYARLTEAARLYRLNLTDKVIINGNRKSATLRKIEALGYKPPCHWSEKFIQILIVLGVPRENIIAIGAEDAFDTVSEARLVGDYVFKHNIKNLTIVTSKFHTHRAGYIWEKLYPNKLKLNMVAAQDDPFDPNSWWKNGRQIRALLGEYGGWFYYFWHN